MEKKLLFLFFFFLFQNVRADDTDQSLIRITNHTRIRYALELLRQGNAAQKETPVMSYPCSEKIFVSEERFVNPGTYKVRIKKCEQSFFQKKAIEITVDATNNHVFIILTTTEKDDLEGKITYLADYKRKDLQEEAPVIKPNIDGNYEIILPNLDHVPQPDTSHTRDDDSRRVSFLQKLKSALVKK